MRPGPWILPCLLFPLILGCPKSRGELAVADGPAADEPTVDDEAPPVEEELPPDTPLPDDDAPCGHGAWLEFFDAHDGVSRHVEGAWWSSDLGWGTLVGVETPLADEPSLSEIMGAWHWDGGQTAGVFYGITSQGEGWVSGEFYWPNDEVAGRLDGDFAGDYAETSWAAKIGEFAAEWYLDGWGGGELWGEWVRYEDWGELFGGLSVEGPSYGGAYADLYSATEGPAGFQKGLWWFDGPGPWGWYAGAWVTPLDEDGSAEGSFAAEWTMFDDSYGQVWGEYFAPQCVPAGDEAPAP